jgi:hypothetical protein
MKILEIQYKKMAIGVRLRDFVGFVEFCLLSGSCWRMGCLLAAFFL